MVRLDEILEENKIEVVHILKVDVEGAERAVLEGASISKYRPWVLVIEATRPNSTEDVSSEWENLVIDAGYSLTLFDGLNKFYVRRDMPEIMKMMTTPANVFDRWKPFEIDDLSQQAVALQNTISEMSDKFSEELSARDIAFRKAEEYAVSLLVRAERAEEYAVSLETEYSHNSKNDSTI